MEKSLVMAMIVKSTFQKESTCGFHLMKMEPKSSREYWSVCLVKHTKHKSSSRMIWM